MEKKKKQLPDHSFELGLQARQSIINNFAHINQLTDEELERLINHNDAQSQALLMATGYFISRTCGQLNKLYEKTTQLAIRQRDSTISVEHVKHSYGADLVIDGKDGEVKTSMVTIRGRYKSNWMFCLDFKSVDTRDEDAVARYMRDKYKGSIILNAVFKEEIISSFTLSGEFFALYVARCATIRRGGKATINLGCGFCEKHKTYHRIAKYVQFDKQLAKKKVKHFTEDEWEEIEARQRPCKGL